MIRVAGLYARVSTADQAPENQLLALREYAKTRGWRTVEFSDRGVSGTRDRRPGLDAMMALARRRKVDAVVVTKLDRLARSVRHLVALAGELEAVGVDLVVVDQSLDTSTPSGRLLFHVLGAISEFERSLIVDRVNAGLRRARAQGKRLGRPRVHRVDANDARELLSRGWSLRAVARKYGAHPTAVTRALVAAGVANPGCRSLTKPAPIAMSGNSHRPSQKGVFS